MPGFIPYGTSSATRGMLDPISGGTPAPTSHTVSTGVKKAHVPKVKGTVTYGTKRAKPKPSKPSKPSKAPTHPAAPMPSDAALIAAATRLQFGPQEQGLQQQLNQNVRFTSGLPAWYQNALSQIRGLQAAGNQTSQQTLQNIQNYNSTPTLNNPTDQQAALARNSLNSQYGAMVGRDANANSAGMDRLAAALAIQQGNTQNMANAERQNILGQQTALKGQEGAFATDYGARLQAAAQKAALDAANLAIKKGTLAYLTGNAQSLAKDRTAKQKVARSNVRLKGQSQAETKRQHQVSAQLEKNRQAEKAYLDAHPELKGKPKAKGPTLIQSNKAQEQFDSAQAKIRTRFGDKKFDPAKEADLLSTSKHAIPRDIALAAAQLIKNQNLGVRGIDDPGLAKRLRKRYGIKVPVVRQSPVIGGVVKGLLDQIPGG